MNEKKEDLCILILSCDKYADAWNPLAKSFDFFWKDCQFDIFLCSEKLKFTHERIRNIAVGKTMSWSEMLITVLVGLAYKVILYIQEDYILKGKIDNSTILSYLIFLNHKIAC